MNTTEEFLRHILPHEGWYGIFILPTKRLFWSKNFDELAATCNREDQPGKHVYYTCASFSEPTKRTAANAVRVRDLWLDVDVGENKPYATKNEAFQACERFRVAVGLPLPTYVSSGGGLYAHWTLVSDLDPAEWLKYARALKAACTRHGFHADPTRTADLASVLRPVGTNNRKYDPVRLVECGPLVGPYELAQFKNLLTDGPAAKPTVNVGAVPKLAAALADIYTHTPCSGQIIAGRCKQLGRLREERGLIPEPLRHAGYGVLAYCDDGRELAGEWNQRKKHPPYTPEQIDKKFKQLKKLSGATLCERFHYLDPKTCEACPHWQKINSPISLGKEDPKPVDTGLPPLPKDFYWDDNGALITKKGIANGGSIDIVICGHSVYLAAIHAGETRGEHNLVFRRKLPQYDWEDVTTSTQTMLGPQPFTELSKAGVVIHESTLFLKYVRAAMDLYHTNTKLGMRFDQFGWKHDNTAFLYGLKLYTAKGIERASGSEEIEFRSAKDRLGPCRGGSLAVWKRTCSAVFSSGCESIACGVLASFGSPLIRFQDQTEGGAVLHWVTMESGTGKSMGLHAACSVWGRRDEGLGLTRRDTETTKMITFGALGNLPVVHDELTLRDPELVREFIEAFTEGRDRMRANQAGKIQHNQSSWQTILFSAANTSLVDMLSLTNARDVMAYRVLEFDASLPPDVHRQGEAIKNTLIANSGHAGHVYLQWLTQPKNLKWAIDSVHSVRDEIWQKTKWEAKYRFWVRTIAAIAVAGHIVRDLGLLELEPKRLVEWLIDYCNKQINEEGDSDAIVGSLSDFFHIHAAECLVVAGAYVTGKPAIIHNTPRSKLIMRYEKNEKRCYITLSAIREYLVKKNTPYRAFLNGLEKREMLLKRRTQIMLNAGTDLPGGKVWCMCVNMHHDEIKGANPFLKLVPKDAPGASSPRTESER